MTNIAIISSSVRTDRASHRVALFFKNFCTEQHLAHADLIDLKKYNFPLFTERLKYDQSPTAEMLDFANRIKSADGVLIVTPEYNGGYPAALKNAVDLLYDEWHKKPVALAAVSDGDFGGTQVITSLFFTLWKMHAWVVPARFHVQRVDQTYDEQGNPADRSLTEKLAKKFLRELLWAIEANKRMEDYKS
jgi:NAD(P)H-dependent FMN reductase